MSGLVAKRFWREVTVEPAGGGFAIRLDARTLQTPAKAAMILPTMAMAVAVADEWRAVDQKIDPQTMPVTRAANAAIDKVAPQFDEVAALIAAYGETDLLCYRTPGPPEMARAQAAAWDPMLDWAAERLGARLRTTVGVAPVAQPPAATLALTDRVRAASNFQLTALYDLVAISGSLILGLAATTDDFPLESLWTLSRFDEDWQEQAWGRDEDSFAKAKIKQKDFLFASNFWKLSSGTGK